VVHVARTGDAVCSILYLQLNPKRLLKPARKSDNIKNLSQRNIVTRIGFSWLWLQSCGRLLLARLVNRRIPEEPANLLTS
jgi:hypothetical protein